MPDFYPDIYEYLETQRNSRSVTSKDLDSTVYKVRANTGLTYETSSEVVNRFFEEMRNVMLRGEAVTLRRFGKLYIVSPRNGSKTQTFAKFEASDKLLDTINDKD
jgi:nucleoid DNA-binding protein